MDISTHSARGSATGRVSGLPADARGVLAAARARRAAADRAEADLLELAVQWAVIHPAETLDDAESFVSRVHAWGGEETHLALAGSGAPLLREFAAAEFASAIGVGTESGKYYLGHALELRYRLPQLWARVISGDLAVWKARRVAEQTIGQQLSVEAAGFVDTHVAALAHKVKPAQLGRLVEEAIGRFMPEAERIRREAEDRRHFEVETDQISRTPCAPSPQSWLTSDARSRSMPAAPPRSASSPAASSPSTSDRPRPTGPPPPPRD